MPRRIIVDIRRNELHTHRTDVWPWEVPILQFIHKNDVKEIGEHDVENRVLDPQVEYERLERRYGFDKETHEIRVAAVYGAGPLGVQRLADAMKRHIEEQAEIDGKAAAAAAETDGAPAPSEQRGKKRASS